MIRQALVSVSLLATFAGPAYAADLMTADEIRERMRAGVDHISNDELMSRIAANEDIVLIADHTGYNSFLRLERFEINDPTEGVVNLLDGVTVPQVPPLTASGHQFQINLQITRADVSGERQGAKPIFYWDAVP